MDIVGSFGYAGQNIVYLDAEKYCYISGAGIVIVDPSGPKDIIWRHENGVSAITAHVLQKWLVIAPNVASLSLEVLDIALQKVLFSMRNPTTVSIVQMSFCKDASRLVALTDFVDHRIILWSTSTRDILSSFKLEEHMTKIIFNPANPSKIALWDDENICVGEYYEILGVYDLKLTKYEILQETDQLFSSGALPEEKTQKHNINEDIQPLSFTNPIGFLCWSSLDSLYIGTTQGYYFQINLESKVSIRIGNGHAQRGDSSPTAAILTNEYLIVGAADGTIKWYPQKLIQAIISRAGGLQPIEPSYFKPVKIARLQRGKNSLHALCTMAVCPIYSIITVGSEDGTIHNIGLDLQQSNRPEEEEIPESDDPVAALLNSLPALPEQIVIEPFIDLQIGAVLCAKSLYIQVMQTQDGIPINEYSGTLSLLIAGSHTGSVMFWRTPVPSEADLARGTIGIRKSTPRMPQAMYRLALNQSPGDASTASSTAAVTQLEIMSAVCKHGGRLLAVGTSDGWLEIWLVEAFESEDEDGEGDEEEGLFYLKVTKVMRRHLFESPVSLISTCDTKPLVAITSHMSDQVYVLSFHQTSPFVEISAYFSIVADNMDPTLIGMPRCLCWHKSTLWIVTEKGFFVCVSSITEKPNHESSTSDHIGYIATSLDHVGAGLLSSTGLFLLPDLISNRLLVSAALPASTTVTSPVPGSSPLSRSNSSDEFFPTHIDHSSSVMAMSKSLLGTLVATGCIDGTIYIWSCEVHSGKLKMELVNRFRVHVSAILALEFSVDSSVLLSCAADGSVFITNVDKMHVLKKDPRPFSIKLNEDIIRDTILLEEESTPIHRLWSELHREHIASILRDRYSGPIRTIADSVSNLRYKLDQMLVHNMQCDEMERMDASEFVVNVAGINQSISHNESEATVVRKYYEDECLKNELIAARIRAACWDANEVQSRCLLPIQEDKAQFLAVWSFPIKKYTDTDIMKLDRVKRLRALEMRAQISHGGGLIQLVPSGSTRSAWITAIEGSPVNITWLVNDGARWPSADVEGMLSTKDRIESESNSKAISNKENTSAAAGNGDEEDEASIAENDVTEHDVDFKNVLNLLYPPQAVRTQVQKRTQILLLKDVCRKIRSLFNEKFEALSMEKDDVIASVETLNIRIHEILGELRLREDVFKPTLRDVEIRLSGILVGDDELQNRPYISETTIQKRLQEEEERRKRELANAKDDSKGRALVDMMNGTLEVKRDVFAEASSLQKPAWMEGLSVDLMTDAQKKEAEEYEAKYKELQEEQSKYKKALEIELKRLRSDVKDLWKNFDDKVDRLAKLKMLTEREILSHELYMARVALGMANQDQLRASLKQIDKNIIVAEQTLREKQESCAKFTETVQAAQEAMVRVSEEEKNCSKYFHRDIRQKCDFQFDQQQLSELTKFFRMRPNQDGGDDMDDMDMTGSEATSFGFSADTRKSSSMKASRSNRMRSSRHRTQRHGKSKSSQAKSKLGTSKASASAKASHGQTGGRLGPMQEAALAMKEQQEELPATNIKDPFYNVILRQEREARHQQQIQPSLDPLEIPETLQIDQFFWAKMNELRTAHIQKEIEAAATKLTYNTLKKKLDDLMVEEGVLKEHVRTLCTTREEILHSLHLTDKDLQCVVAIRQGQDEVDKDVVATDYTESALIPVAVVNKYNTRILELGQDKIGALTRIKQFRRKINLLNWEARHTELEARHIEEYITDLQLFRVTRNMQQLIRDGEEGGAKEKRGSDRKDKSSSPSKKEVAVPRDTSVRMSKILQDNQKLKRLLRTRAEENELLERRIEDLRVQIEERRSVLQSRSDARGEDADPAVTTMKRMKKVVTRRRLSDMSSMQAQEIAFLRQELEKIRDKTFPSFVKAFRSRMHTNPDDK